MERAEFGYSSKVAEIAEISEWTDWMRRKLVQGGIELPSEEASALYAANSLRLADRVRRLCRHLPSSLRSKLIEATILYQSWSHYVRLHEKVKFTGVYPKNELRIVEADSYIRPMDSEGQLHLVEANDASQYVVRFPKTFLHDKVMATEIICATLMRMVGLSVPSAAVIVIGKKLRQVVAQRTEPRFRTPAAGTEVCCGFRNVVCDDTNAAFGRPAAGPRHCPRNSRQLLGALIFDVWTLNLSPQQPAWSFNYQTGRFGPVFIDQSHCLMGADWGDFLVSTYKQMVPPHRTAGTLRRWQQAEPWLHRIDNLDMNRIWDLVFHLPRQFYGGDRSSIMRVLDKLEQRRWDLRRAMHYLIQSGYFENFKSEEEPNKKLPRSDPQQPVLRELPTVRQTSLR